MKEVLIVDTPEVVDLSELISSILETMNTIQDRLEGIQETQAEIVEKLDNIGLGDGLGLTEYES